MEAPLMTNPIHVDFNDFGIKYVNKKDAEHLLNALKDYYKVEIDLTGRVLWNHT